MNEIRIGERAGECVFCAEGEKAWLRGMGEVLFGLNGQDSGPIRTQGLVVVNTLTGRYEGPDWSC